MSLECTFLRKQKLAFAWTKPGATRHPHSYRQSLFEHVVREKASICLAGLYQGFRLKNNIRIEAKCGKPKAERCDNSLFFFPQGFPVGDNKKSQSLSGRASPRARLPKSRMRTTWYPARATSSVIMDLAVLMMSSMGGHQEQRAVLQGLIRGQRFRRKADSVTTENDEHLWALPHWRKEIPGFRPPCVSKRSQVGFESYFPGLDNVGENIRE